MQPKDSMLLNFLYFLDPSNGAQFDWIQFKLG
jgi:hypothetical protein